MTKKEVQNRVLHNGEIIKLSDFIWDESTNTLTTTYNLKNLVFNFNWINNINFNSNAALNSDSIFNTGDNCTFNTGFGSDCTFNTGNNCTFETGSGCTFNTGDNCVFNTAACCTFNTGSYCTFTSMSNCIFNTGSNCTLIRVDELELIELNEYSEIRTNGYKVKGYVRKNNDKKFILGNEKNSYNISEIIKSTQVQGSDKLVEYFNK